MFAASRIDQLVFAHVDVDLYAPRLASFEYFYDRMVPGGLLVCDDYGFGPCQGANQAVDEFMAGLSGEGDRQSDRIEHVIKQP